MIRRPARSASAHSLIAVFAVVAGPVALAGGAGALSGCAHAQDIDGAPATPHSAKVSHDSAPAMSADEEVIAVDTAVAEPRAPEPVQGASHPRLSRTVTLGETQVEPVGEAPPGGPPGPTVIVNNYVVQQPMPYYGAYYYGGGYGVGYAGGYGGYGGGFAYRTPGAGGFGNGGFGSRAAPARAGGGYRGTGWEGAGGRSAAPGHMPSVGGNYSSPQSAGPRPMR